MTGQLDDLYLKKFSGLTRLWGEGCLEILSRAHVCVLGLGGVGSWTVESLARSGIGRFTLVDLDDICLTNTNRQLHAVDSQVGRLKTEAMTDRILAVNPRAQITALPTFLTPGNAQDILTQDMNFVVDAMDSVPDKAAAAKICLERKIPLVVCGGSGGKIDPTQVRQGDLGDERGDALLKGLKRKLKSEYAIDPGSNGFYGIPAVFSLEPSIKPWGLCAALPDKPSAGERINCTTGYGAASFLTGTFGFTLAAYVVKNLVSAQGNS